MNLYVILMQGPCQSSLYCSHFSKCAAKASTMFLYSLAAFKFFSLGKLIMMCLGLISFVFFLLGIY